MGAPKWITIKICYPGSTLIMGIMQLMESNNECQLSLDTLGQISKTPLQRCY